MANDKNILSASEFSAVLDISTDGIISVDEEQHILMFNRGAEKIFGYSREEVIGNSLSMLIPDGSREAHSRHVKEFAQSEISSKLMGERSDVFGRKKDGSVFPAEVSISKAVSNQRVVSIAVIRDVSERRKKEEKIESSLREKELLLEEVHHRVKNNLQIISSLLNLQIDALGEGPGSEAIQDAQSRVKSIALIHESLYRSHDFAKIVFFEYLGELAQNLLLSTGMLHRVDVEVEPSNETLELDKAVPSGLIVNELITNSLKHAFPRDSKGLIQIRFKAQENNEFLLEVEDNGRGLPEDLDILQSKTLGIQLVTNLTAQLEGNIEFVDKNGGGLLVRIIFRNLRER
jgi:PAS domain S-box-containing protein